jgi:scyllo-inositol 2-dehydrogenase (NAD+)
MSGGSPIRTALLGVGRMGSFHRRVITERCPDVQLVAFGDPVVGPTGDDQAAWYPAVDEALAHPQLEACIVATPTPAHAGVVRAALDRGLHVLCEKPLTLDPDEDETLAGLAADRGLLLQVGFWRRYAPVWVRARELCAAAAIGRVVFVRLSQWDASLPPVVFCDPLVSGGLAVDCGVHEFDLVEWVTDQHVLAVDARTADLVHPELEAVGDVDNMVALLKLDGGAVAVVDLSRNARYGDDVRTELLGAEGALFIETLPHARLRLATAAGSRTVLEAGDAQTDGVAAQASAFARAVRGEQPPVGPGGLESARATRIALAVREAALHGSSVTVDQPRPAGTR